MTIEDDIRFYIAEKVAMSDNPLDVISSIEFTLDELRKIYKDRVEIWKKIR